MTWCRSATRSCGASAIAARCVPAECFFAQSNAVKGEFPVHEALDRLVANTGLLVLKDERSGAIMISRGLAPGARDSLSRSTTKPPNGTEEPAKTMKRRTLAAVLGSWLALASDPALAQSTSTTGSATAQSSGVIEGRVFNATTGEYVRNAEIRLQGSNRTTYSEDGGRYRLVNVPAGEATIAVSYAGYPAVNATVSVAGGQAITRDFELGTAPAQPAAGEALKLGQYVVSAEREGNAKAIMQQRRNMNITTSVASDIFGDVAEGNVGEFLKFLPGVDVEYVDAESRGRPRAVACEPAQRVDQIAAFEFVQRRQVCERMRACLSWWGRGNRQIDGFDHAGNRSDEGFHDELQSHAMSGWTTRRRHAPSTGDTCGSPALNG